MDGEECLLVFFSFMPLLSFYIYTVPAQCLCPHRVLFPASFTSHSSLNLGPPPFSPTFYYSPPTRFPCLLPQLLPLLSPHCIILPLVYCPYPFHISVPPIPLQVSLCHTLISFCSIPPPHLRYTWPCPLAPLHTGAELGKWI